MKKIVNQLSVFVLIMVLLAALGGCTLKPNPAGSDAPEDAAWWGEYKGEAFKLYVSNYNGKSFWFSFVEDDQTKFEGAAPVYPEDFFKAEYMDLAFSLSDDASSIIVTQWEMRDDSEERTQFTGIYNRVYD